MPAIVVPRNLNISNSVTIQLIGYCDAANSAQGCSLYLRIIHADHTISTNLICSKSRVNQLNKKPTTPRLELNSALLLAKLACKVHNTLIKKLGSKITVHLFSDSQIALAWLKTEPIRLSVFVANRVREINKLTGSFNWHYVNTLENPADCLSRGLDPLSLKDHVLWWKGPQYLLKKELFDSINQDNIVLKNLPELKTKICCNNVTEEMLEFNIEKYSSLLKAKRILAYILRFYNNCKLSKDDRINCNSLTAKELENALNCIIKIQQRKSFSSEISNLLNDKPIKGNLATLNPFLDKEGLLRVGGRLQNSDLPYSQKHQIILPRSCHLTSLIISDAHVNL